MPSPAARLHVVALPAPLPHLDSCLSSPTLSTDLIEGNHSDKKPPTMMPPPPHSGAVRASSIQPHHLTSSPALSTPIKMPCRSLEPIQNTPHHRHHRRHNEPFVWQREEVTVAVVGERAGPAAPAVDWSSRTPGSTSLIVKRAGALPKTLHFSLLSPVLFASPTPSPAPLPDNNDSGAPLISLARFNSISGCAHLSSRCCSP